MTTDTRTSPPLTPSLNERFQECMRRIERVRARLALENAAVDHNLLGELRLLVAALPLSTGEFSVAENRLKNAARYLASAERGAARYELNLLGRSLTNNAHYRAATSRTGMR